MKKKTLFLSLVLICSLIAFAFISKPIPVSKPTTQVSISTDDSDAYWYEEMDALNDIAYDTWVEDGMPGGDDIGTKIKQQFYHYCCKSSNQEFWSPGDAARWVINVGMGGRNNPNHVHYIDWGMNGCCGGAGLTWEPKVKYWTSEPCSEICNW